MHDKTSQAIEKIFEKRTEFIVIGLTGRTGSGCTTVAKILTENFNKNNLVSLPKPKESGFDNNEEREYKIIYNYLLCMSNDWELFYKISISDIITLFILNNDFENFQKYIQTKVDEYAGKNNKENLNLKIDQKERFEDGIKNYYEAAFEERNRCKEISN